MQQYFRHPATAGGLTALMVLIWGYWFFSGHRPATTTRERVAFAGTLSVGGKPLTTGNLALVPTDMSNSEEQLAKIDRGNFRFESVPVGEYELLVDPTAKASEPAVLTPETDDSIVYREATRTLVRLTKDTANYQVRLVRP